MKTEPLTNIGGIIDTTTLEVNMEIRTHFREKEYIEGAQVAINYMNMPKTCFNCKKIGPLCPTGGSSAYACRVKTPETDWDEVYEKEAEERELIKDDLKKNIEEAEKYVFEDIEIDIAKNSEKKRGNDNMIPEGFKIAGIRVRGKENMSKDDCKEILGYDKV